MQTVRDNLRWYIAAAPATRAQLAERGERPLAYHRELYAVAEEAARGLALLEERGEEAFLAEAAAQRGPCRRAWRMWAWYLRHERGEV